GVALERVLAPGESHGYRIVCPSGSYVFAVVEQKGVDVMVSVSAPDGAPLLDVDTPTEPSGREGAETVPFVADRAGTYRLVVRALQPKAEGAYVVRVQETRPATASDRRRFEARRLWAEGDHARAHPVAGSLSKAHETYERSAELLEQIGD